MKSNKWALNSPIKAGRGLLLTSMLALALGGANVAFAKGGVAGNPGGAGGTAKPPAKNLVSAFPVSPFPVPAKAVTDACVGITGCAVGPGLNGFDITGYMQSATVAKAGTDRIRVGGQAICPTAGLPANSKFLGGTVKINGVTITVPCNTIVQMPANTYTWADFINAARGTEEWDAGTDSIRGFKTHGDISPMPYEVHIVGNSVNSNPGGPVTENIAALIYVSQQTTNAGSGIITSFNWANGRINVDNGLGGTTILEINDPNGRFGRPNSPDQRFSVDDQNPTVHSGTGYPMCVPRSKASPLDAANNIVAANDDKLCPQVNRPKVNGGCRNFTAAGLLVLPKSGELPAPVATDVFCKSFVMPPVNPTLGIAGVVSAKAGRTLSQPDAREQAPLEVGDFVTWSGTLFQDKATSQDIVSVHTLEANVGIHTQPGTQPAYISIGEFGLGTVDPPPAPAAGLPVNFNGVAAEITNRFFMETSTTDVITPVDIYYMDVDPATGAIHNRWVTPFNMTGECDPALALASTCFGAEGGIRTQFTGPQNMRARIRAIKPPTNLLNQPSRYMRVVQRTLCAPSQTLLTILGVPQFNANGDQIIDTTAQDACINAAYPAQPANGIYGTGVANGLAHGTYLAPVFEYVFPENTQAGQPIIPNDFWDLPFLLNGEGGLANGQPGPLDPAPW